MPEEINRIIVDHLSDLLFVTEESGLRNLHDEGISSAKVYFVGNTMIDSLLALKDKAEASTILDELEFRSCTEKGEVDNAIARYALLTLHRPSNVDNRDTFKNILAGLEDLAADCPIIFPVHPRTRQRISEFRLESASVRCNGNRPNAPNHRNGIIFTDPLGYLDFLCLMKHAAIVITDSGGIQEETTCLGIPCVTVRGNTERPITVQIGTNTLAGTTQESIREAIYWQSRRKSSACMPEHWDGQAAARIVDVLARTHGTRIITSHVGYRNGKKHEVGTVENHKATVATKIA